MVVRLIPTYCVLYVSSILVYSIAQLTFPYHINYLNWLNTRIVRQLHRVCSTIITRYPSDRPTIILLILKCFNSMFIMCTPKINILALKLACNSMCIDP